MGIEGDTIGSLPRRMLGCGSYDYFACDMLEAAHGRAPAVATGVKSAQAPTSSYSHIRVTATLRLSVPAETVHAATRGENITVIFINNTTYGMTGGQMAPTTLPGQVTQTTPFGRDPKVAGLPRNEYAKCCLSSAGAALCRAEFPVDSTPRTSMHCQKGDQKGL